MYIVLNLNMDYCNYKHVNPLAHRAHRVEDKILNLDLTDII